MQFTIIFVEEIITDQNWLVTTSKFCTFLQNTRFNKVLWKLLPRWKMPHSNRQYFVKLLYALNNQCLIQNIQILVCLKSKCDDTNRHYPQISDLHSFYLKGHSIRTFGYGSKNQNIFSVLCNQLHWTQIFHNMIFSMFECRLHVYGARIGSDMNDSSIMIFLKGYVDRIWK